MYRKEIEQLEAKRSKLVQEGAEEWDVKNAASRPGIIYTLYCLTNVENSLRCPKNQRS